jgi:ATP-binding cassette, subfamily B, bacterial
MTAGLDGGWRAQVRCVRAAASVVWSASPVLTSGLVVISLAAGLVSPAVAWLQRDVLDSLVTVGRAVPSRADSVLGGRDLLMVAALGLAGVVTAVVPQVQGYISSTLGRVTGVVIYDRVYRAVSAWPGIARFESPAFADKLQLATQAQNTAASLLSSALGIGQSLVTAVTFVAILATINPVLLTVIVGIQMLAIAANLGNARRQAQLQVENAYRTRRQMSFGSLLTSAVAAKEVRLFGLDRFLRSRMLAELQVTNAAGRALARRELRIESAMATLSACVSAGGLLWIVARVVAGRFPVGDVTMFLMAALGLQSAMNQVAMAMGNVTQSLMPFGAYTSVVSALPDLPVRKCPLPVPELSCGITLDNVWFRYNEAHPWVLRGVSMVIPAGAKVALVGLNGSGKSTLVKLLCRLYDPVRGSILWDGIDIRELDPAALRQRITGVFQDYVTYDLTAAENIGVGELALIGDWDAIRGAAALAGADTDIARLPDGYDTMLSRVFLRSRKDARAGAMLSGGQRQRIALARALLRTGRDLLIVDEPMSSLDAEAEHAMNSRLAQAQTGRATVLISHRLASVRDSDEIVVLSDGTVAERGTHAQLMAAGGPYARLFALQARGYRDLGEADHIVAPQGVRG